MDIQQFLDERGGVIDRALDQSLPAADEPPPSIHQAMRYSVFAGGKRLRPILCLEAGRVAGAAESDVMPVALALEFIHTYSLIHDDLPALDNDDLRRGQLTLHKKFGEALAILAGDALLTRAFELLANWVEAGASTRKRIAAFQEVAAAAGTLNGLIGGQVVDLEAEGKSVTAELLHYIHSSKTGALFRAAVRSGALLGNCSQRVIEALSTYGGHIGLAFQIVDDILDVVSSAEVLGKTPGKDHSTRKATYPALFGLEESRQQARRLVKEAIRALECFGGEADSLRSLARFFVERAA